MELKLAKPFVVDVFNQLKTAKTIQDIIEVEESFFEPKYRMDAKAYPKIEFSITPEDIQILQQQGALNAEYGMTPEAVKESSDPLIKLLYALAWKNGDLKKLKHIAKGIAEINQTDSEQNEALVFYQFGRYLTKKDGEPIIDQHVIRAFASYQLNDEEQIAHYLKLSVLNAKHKQMINSYISWLKSNELSEELRAQKDYSYYIDRVLFATGKRIKQK